MNPRTTFLGDGGGRVADVRKIAVVRASGVGDYLFSLPALEALEAAYSDAEIVLLAKPWHKEFLSGRPGPVDRVEVLPAIAGVGANSGSSLAGETEVEDFCQRMRDERFDLALQIHGGGRHSNPFVRRLGARLSIGLKSEDAMPLDRWVPYVYFQPEVMRYLEVVSLVGAVPRRLEARLTLTPGDLAEAESVVPGDQPLVLLHPGATDPRRCWPVEKFASLGDRLAEAGARVAVSGTEIERDLVDAVLKAMRREAMDLCGRLSLGGLAGFVARCQLVVSNDSGPLHLAAAVGTRTVGIYWAGNLINGAALTRTRHRPVASWRMECPECGQNCMEGSCLHGSSFVADVTVDEVASATFDLLERGPDLD